MFIPMGLGALIPAWLGRNPHRAAAPLLAAHRAAMATPPPAPARPSPRPAPAGDPVERLRKLGELRDAGVLSAAEFDAAKARILAEF